MAFDTITPYVSSFPRDDELFNEIFRKSVTMYNLFNQLCCFYRRRQSERTSRFNLDSPRMDARTQPPGGRTPNYQPWVVGRTVVPRSEKDRVGRDATYNLQRMASFGSGSEVYDQLQASPTEGRRVFEGLRPEHQPVCDERVCYCRV